MHLDMRTELKICWLMPEENHYFTYYFLRYVYVKYSIFIKTRFFQNKDQIAV